MSTGNIEEHPAVPRRTLRHLVVTCVEAVRGVPLSVTSSLTITPGTVHALSENGAGSPRSARSFGRHHSDEGDDAGW